MTKSHIKGIKFNRLQLHKCILLLDADHSVDLVLSIPKSNRSSSAKPLSSPVDLTHIDAFEIDKYACKPHPKLNLLAENYPLTLPRFLKTQFDKFDIYFKVQIAIVDCEKFVPLYHAARFEKAIDRDVYTCWGPGAFKYDYETGLNRRLIDLAGRTWIGLATERRDFWGGLSNVDQFQSFYTVLNSRYMLEVKFHIGNSADKALIPVLREYFEEAYNSIINSIRVTGNEKLREHERRAREKYSQLFREPQTGPVQWQEKPLPSLDQIQDDMGIDYSDQIDYWQSYYDDDLFSINMSPDESVSSNNLSDDEYLVSPYTSSSEVKKNSLPLGSLERTPVIEASLSHQQKLTEQMKASYATHEDFDHG